MKAMWFVFGMAITAALIVLSIYVPTLRPALILTAIGISIGVPIATWIQPSNAPKLDYFCYGLGVLGLAAWFLFRAFDVCAMWERPIS